MSRTIKRIGLATVGAMAAVVVAVASNATAAGFTIYSPTNSDYPQKVDFVVACTVSHEANDDPIVYPGQPGKSHNHTFSGNPTVNAFSTAESLRAAGQSTCKLSRDTAAYWTPTLYNDGVAVIPYETRAYYRAGTFDGPGVQAPPFGLKIVAGNSAATSPQPANRAGFQCRDSGGNTVPKQSLPPRCPVGDFLEASVVFPNCWDGVNLDSADHKSHMAYADPNVKCPATHPVRVPQLTLAQRYPVDAERGTITLASMGPASSSAMTLHADFINAWDQPTLQMLVDECIHKNTACEDITNNRLPPGSTLPTTTTSTTTRPATTTSTSMPATTTSMLPVTTTQLATTTTTVPPTTTTAPTTTTLPPTTTTTTLSPGQELDRIIAELQAWRAKYQP